MAESKDTNDTVKNEENTANVEVKADAAENEKAETKVETEESKETEKENEDSAKAVEEASPELLAKIKKQVEFYFGDVNMQRDKFLIEQTKLDEGWVPMTVMLNFKMLASLSKNIPVILKALEESDLIEISSDNKKIRRSLEKPLPVYDEKYKKEQEARTIYLKGFPTDLTINVLKAHFENTKAIESIVMRKYKKGKEYFFKGSIFLLFSTLDDAKAFMDQESIKYKETELIKLWMPDYIASKEKEKEERKQKKAENAKPDKKKNNAPERKLPKGCIIHISNVGKECTKEKLKEKFAELETEVAFVDYSMGNPEGWVRLHGENAAVNLLKKLDTNTIKIDDNDITCKVLEGDEEDAYITKIQENIANRNFNQRNKGRFGRKGFKRRNNSPHRNENNKKAHTESV